MGNILKIKWLGLGLGLFTGLACVPAQATVIDWTGGTSTAWATGTNWTGNTAPADDITTDIARFNSVTFTRQPQVVGTRSVNGIQIGDGITATGAVTITGSTTPILNIGSGGITMMANAGTLTISTAPVRLAANQNWANNSSSLLTVSAAVSNTADLSPFTLTLNGSGAGGTTISGVISDGGTTGTTAINVNTTGGGVTTLSSGSNTLTGGITLTQGILRGSQTGSTGTSLGGAVTLGGGELRLVRGGNTNGTTFTAANTTITGNTQITSEVGSGTVGVTHTMGTLNMGAQTLTIAAGSMVASGTAGVTFGATTLTGNATYATAASTNLTLGALTGTSSITKTGSGRLTLNAAATSYSGGVNINEGTLALSNGTASGTGTINLGQTGSSVDATLNPSSVSAFTGGAIQVASGSGLRTLNFSGSGSNAQTTVANAIVLANNLSLLNSQSGTNVSTTLNGGITGTGNLTITNTGNTLTFATADTNHSGSITNSGSGTTIFNSVIGANVTDITNNGSGTLMLSGANTAYAGNVFVSNGTVRVANSSALGSANTLAVGLGATFDLKQTNTNSYDLTLAGLNNISGSGGTVINTGGSARTITLAGSGNYDYSGAITATTAANMAILKSGSGTQTFKGANTYAGTTGVTGGKLIVDMAGGATFTGGSGINVRSGGELVFKGTTIGAVSSATLGTVTSTTSSGALGIVTLQDGVNATATSYTAGGVLLLRGTNLGLNAAGTAGSANLFLTTPPTITGLGTSSVTTIARIIGDDSATGSGAGFVTYDTNGVRLLTSGEYSSTVTAGTNVKATGAITNTGTTTVNSLIIGAGGSISGGTEIRLTSGDVLVAGGANSGISTALSTQGAGGLIITTLNDLAGANINGGGGVTKYGSGTSLFNTVDATVTVNQGVFGVNGGNKVKSTTINNSGTFRINGNGSVLDNSTLTVNAGGTLEYADGVSDDIGALNVNAAGFVKGGSGAFANLGSTTGTSTVDGIISGNLNLIKSGTGTMALNGANTFAGSTTVNQGTLTVGTAGKVGAGDMVIANTNSTAAGTNTVVNLNSSQTVGNFSGSIATPTSGTNTVTANLATGTTLSVNQTSTGVYAGVLAGSGNFTKSGSASLALGGVNTYTGATTVNGGTLLVNGSLDAASTVTVNSGGSLGGSGTVNGTVIINSGGNLSPGNSPGLPTYTDDLTFNTGSSFTFELIANIESGRGTNFDGVNLTGAGSLLTIQSGVSANLVFNGAGSTVLWSNGFWTSSHTWLVFDSENAPTLASPGAIFGTVNTGLDSGGFASTGTFTFSKDVNGDIFLNYAVSVPEPSTYAMLGLGLLSLWALRRKGVKKA